MKRYTTLFVTASVTMQSGDRPVFESTCQAHGFNEYGILGDSQLLDLTPEELEEWQSIAQAIAEFGGYLLGKKERLAKGETPPFVPAPIRRCGECFVCGKPVHADPTSYISREGPYCSHHEHEMFGDEWRWCGEDCCVRWVPAAVDRCLFHGGEDYIPARQERK